MHEWQVVQFLRLALELGVIERPEVRRHIEQWTLDPPDLSAIASNRSGQLVLPSLDELREARSGPPITLHRDRTVREFTERWLEITRAWMLGEHSSAASLITTIVVLSGQLSYDDLRKLLSELWRAMWFFDPHLYVQLQAYACGPGLSQFAARVRSTTEAERAVNEVKERLDAARAAAVDLDHWVELLRQLSPCARYAREVLAVVGGGENELHKRYLDEVSVDIWMLFQTGWWVDQDGIPRLITLVPVGETPDERIQREAEERRAAHVWLRDKVPARGEYEADPRAVRRALKFEARARVSVPDFWLRSAFRYLESSAASPPDELERHDPRQVAVAVMTAGSSGYYRRSPAPWVAAAAKEWRRPSVLGTPSAKERLQAAFIASRDALKAWHSTISRARSRS